MGYNKLIKELRGIVDEAMTNRQTGNNLTTTQSNWEIGKRLSVDEKRGATRAIYGDETLIQISEYLNKRYGKGYGLTNLKYMCKFFRSYKKDQLKPQLNWSHYRTLVQVKEIKLRLKLEKQIIQDGWSQRKLATHVRQLSAKDDRDSFQEDLNRPVGKEGLFQVRHIDRSGKMISYIDLGFNIWLEVLDGELDGMEHKSISQVGESKTSGRVLAYDGSRKNLYVYKVSLDHVVDGLCRIVASTYSQVFARPL